jgi:hypothetical protein
MSIKEVNPMSKRIAEVKVDFPRTHEEHISEVKFADGSKESRAAAYKAVMSNSDYYFTTGGGQKARVEGATSTTGTNYIRTKADSTIKDNLLSLPRY